MKKVYLKPVASTVAFVVNENIAISLPEGAESIPGSIHYINGDGTPNCNQILNSTEIRTGLEPGDYDFDKAMKYIEATISEYSGNQLLLLQSVLDQYAKDGTAGFVCA